MDGPIDVESLLAQATSLGEHKIAERAQMDLFYLCSYILGGEEVLDPKVHGPLCRALRPLLLNKEIQAFYDDPANKGLEFEMPEFPSDYGRTDDEGMPTDEEKAVFMAWQALFMPPDDTAAHADRLNVRLHQLLALMPRGTLKSTVITIGFTIQWHLNYPNDRVLLDSEVYDKSKAFLAEIKGHYETNRKLRKVYATLYKDDLGQGMRPDRNRKFDTWSTEAINLSCRERPRKEPSIDCSGIDSTKNGMHYDIIIADDLHSEKNSKTVAQINKVKDHYDLIFSLLEPEGSLAVIGTRWADSDLYQSIIDDPEDFNFITRAAESPETGELFYPRRLRRGFLNKRKKKNGYLYSCQYMNNPVDQENADFKKSYFEYVTVDEFENIPHNLYGLVDPSYKGDGNSSDYAAFVLGAMGPRGEIYARHVHKDKMIYSQIFNKMAELDAMFHPRFWFVEAIGTKSLEHDFKRMNDERVMQGLPRLNIRFVRHHSSSKEERIMALTPYYERHEAYHVVGGGMIDALEGELQRFPKAKNDDLSDAWANILTIGQKAKGSVEVNPRVQKNRKRLKMLNKPRSPVTGY